MNEDLVEKHQAVRRNIGKSIQDLGRIIDFVTKLETKLESDPAVQISKEDMNGLNEIIGSMVVDTKDVFESFEEFSKVVSDK